MDSAGASTVKCYGEEDVAALIRTLDREEDFHIFAEDVLKTYPHLAQSYTKVCPRRCDLATAAQKALDGSYSFDVRLTELKADIALMVSNCVAFNGPTSDYAEAAAKFERFALDQIDRFIVEQNGGRRVSRLRLPAASPDHHRPQQQSSHVLSDGQKKAAVSDAASPATATFTVPTTREVVHLVDALNRREDGGAFSVDVAEAYPDLRESYEKMCPTPMSLVTMHKRAKEGFYTAASASLFGATVADSFVLLREDVELLVRNCITFNAKVETWVALAHSFQSFAHRRIDDLVLRHAAGLRGTQTGAQRYNAALADAAATASSAAEAAPTRGPSSAGGVNAKPDTRKRDRAGERGSGGTAASASTSASMVAAPSPVSVVNEVAAQIRPTPLQPVLAIPPRLRRRLALEHLRHTQLPLRRIGVTVPRSELYPASPLSAVRENGEAEATDAADGNASTQTVATVDASCSVSHVLRLLRHSIKDFFAARRCRPDFVDAFAFSQREEELYLSVLRIVADQFEATAPHLILYERESAEWAEWTALCALQRSTAAVAGADSSASSSPATTAPRVSDALHYLYLVRFLVQWPQLACLCCTSTTPPMQNGAAAAGGASQGSLRISRDQLKAMAQVALITQEFLGFVEGVEEKLCNR